MKTRITMVAQQRKTLQAFELFRNWEIISGFHPLTRANVVWTHTLITVSYWTQCTANKSVKTVFAIIVYKTRGWKETGKTILSGISQFVDVRTHPALNRCFRYPRRCRSHHKLSLLVVLCHVVSTIPNTEKENDIYLLNKAYSVSLSLFDN